MKESGPIEDPAMWGWSDGVYEISNPKHQITNKSQTPIFNDQNENRFRILKLGGGPARRVGSPAKRGNFGIEFVCIWCLEFGIS